MRKHIAAPVLSLLLLSAATTTARAPNGIKPIPESMFHKVDVPEAILEPPEEFDRTKPPIKQLDPVAKVEVQSTPEAVQEASGDFNFDPEVSWYGPHFYGKRTACGLAYTKTILGVAHKSLPCGTPVTFRYNGKTITVPVIDRGPYVAGRQWDLSGGLCVALDHCFTGPIEYKVN